MNWHPKWNSQMAIAKTIEWYKKTKSLSAKDVLTEQIEAYFNKTN